MTTDTAPKNVHTVASIPSDKISVNSTFDPTPWALRVAPEKRRKLERSLRRDAYRIGLECKIRYYKLTILYYLQYAKVLRMNLICYVHGVFFQIKFNRHERALVKRHNAGDKL